MLKSLCGMFLCIFLFSCSCFAIDVSAQSAILYEPQTKTVLYAKAENKPRQIASTTKIMTAVAALERLDVSDVVTVPRECTGIEGTSMYLKENEKLSVSDLLYGLMLQSGNDAAVTLAYHAGGGDAHEFVSIMNDTAKRIGMTNTQFKNPNGLTEEGHVSTAYDMALLAAYAMEIPYFAELVSTNSKQVAGRHLTNHNKLLRMYEGADGIKTGFTKAAGRCLVSSATRDNMRLIAVTLNAPDDWNDHIRMLNFGFEGYALAENSKYGSEISRVSVVGGVSESVSAVTAGDVSILLSREEASRVKKQIFIPRFLYAPVSRGEVIGKIQYVLDGKVIDESSIISNDTVGIQKKTSVFDRLFKYLRGN